MMQYDMTSKKPESTVENAGIRSGYGKMHAFRNGLMMEEHVAMLGDHGMVDRNTAVNLLKPLDKDWTYSKAYLQTHPDYTGIQPEMTTFSAAIRRQKKRDREMADFIADYEAGRIDQNGVPIGEDTGSEDEDHSSEPSEMDVTSTKSQGRKRKYRVDPLQPLPSGEDYSEHGYYELLDICRERQIHSSGDTQEVRNLLIQDDINVAQGLPRDIAKWKGSTKKGSRVVVPVKLGGGAGKK